MEFGNPWLRQEVPTFSPPWATLPKWMWLRATAPLLDIISLWLTVLEINVSSSSILHPCLPNEKASVCQLNLCMNEWVSQRHSTARPRPLVGKLLVLNSLGLSTLGVPVDTSFYHSRRKVVMWQNVLPTRRRTQNFSFMKSPSWNTEAVRRDKWLQATRGELHPKDNTEFGCWEKPIRLASTLPLVRQLFPSQYKAGYTGYYIS